MRDKSETIQAKTYQMQDDSNIASRIIKQSIYQSINQSINQSISFKIKRIKRNHDIQKEENIATKMLT